MADAPKRKTEAAKNLDRWRQERNWHSGKDLEGFMDAADADPAAAEDLLRYCGLELCRGTLDPAVQWWLGHKLLNVSFDPKNAVAILGLKGARRGPPISLARLRHIRNAVLDGQTISEAIKKLQKAGVLSARFGTIQAIEKVYQRHRLILEELIPQLPHHRPKGRGRPKKKGR